MSTPTIRTIELLRLIPPWPRRIDVNRLHQHLSDRGLGTTRRRPRRLLADLTAHVPLDSDDRDEPYGGCWMEGSTPPVVAAMDVPTAVTPPEAVAQMGALLPTSFRVALAPLLEGARRVPTDLPHRLDRRVSSAWRVSDCGDLTCTRRRWSQWRRCWPAPRGCCSRSRRGAGGVTGV